MSEPIIDLGIGFLFAVLLAFGTVAAMRMRASRSAVSCASHPCRRR
jgi:hypothetical protein